MKTFVHEKLARRRRTQALTLSFLGLAVLIGGLVVNFRGDFRTAYFMLIAGTILSWAGVVLSDRWVSAPRPQVVLPEALSKFSGRVYALFLWALPADFVFMAPWGLTVMHVHNHDGPAQVTGAKWRDGRSLPVRLFRFARRPVRHPGTLLELEIDSLREALSKADPALAEVPLEGIAVFTNPRVDLKREDPDLPVLLPDELEAWGRKALKAKARLQPEMRLKLEQVLEEMAAERMH